MNALDMIKDAIKQSTVGYFIDIRYRDERLPNLYRGPAHFDYSSDTKLHIFNMNRGSEEYFSFQDSFYLEKIRGAYLSKENEWRPISYDTEELKKLSNRKIHLNGSDKLLTLQDLMRLENIEGYENKILK